MNYPINPDWKMEILNKEIKRGGYQSALFDFDGTISLIRQGWQEVMVPYFNEEVLENTDAKDHDEVNKCVQDFVDLLTGKQTIYQCIRLAEEIEARGGKAKDPLEYKKEYHRRLMERIHQRLEGLKEGSIEPEDMIVPGALAFLEKLRSFGLKLYLASGTDEEYVLQEASLLGVTDLFDGGIYGARDEYKLFSKAKVIQRIIESNNLSGNQLIGFGDGYVEIENVKEVHGTAVGVASDEEKRTGINEWKRNRLIQAGADMIIPDFREVETITSYFITER